MVDRIEFKELETEEVPVTSAVLLGAAHHLGTYCNKDFTTFVQKRFETKDPRATLDEGKAVTNCALEFFRKLKAACNKEFTDHWTCLDYNNQYYGQCRKTQKVYDECVLKNLGLESKQSDIYGKF
uniref:NADH dehydrogenase [ubiquinone] 1 alpha subcomplex subunit 8 n=2 Tax=Clytia hemisphaerica TaxID=252671 RepID=A0A7M5V8N6_9CNID